MAYSKIGIRIFYCRFRPEIINIIDLDVRATTIFIRIGINTLVSNN
jgi:hypothetical protein